MFTDLNKFFVKVDELKSSFKTRLSDAVSIQSVSVSDIHEKQKMAEFLRDQINELGGNAELKKLNSDNLPPVVAAQYPKIQDSTKKTILIYGHYDVQHTDDPAKWKHPPFKVTEDTRESDNKRCYFGRGTTDDKGPVIGWLNDLEAYKKASVNVPVNLRFLFEDMEESGSTGLPDFMKTDDSKNLFKNVDAACISDNYWLGTTKSCLEYGLRGIAYFSMTISGPKQELHSGLFGGTVYEPMTDLTILLSKLVDSQGKILIPGIETDVEPLSKEEEDTYKTIQYTTEDFYSATGSHTAIYDDPVKTLMARWRYPSLSIHGIEGAYSGSETKTSIPPSVTGKFSIRTVPYMTTEKVKKLVTDYLAAEWKKLKSKNKFDIVLNDSGEPWRTNPNHKNFRAAATATRAVWGTDPDHTREGGSIPVSLNIQDGLGEEGGKPKSLVLLPIGTANDGAHAPNESIPINNYIEGTKVLGAYLHEFAAAS